MSKTPFLPGKFYHIYNRGNNGENLFKEERNYPFFLNKYWKYIPKIADTYAYCLLKNHFHFLIRIKKLHAFHNFKEGRSLASFIGQHFGSCFGAYTKAINCGYKRTGSLFEKPLHRKPVFSTDYFLKLVLYIHHNPVHHCFVDDFEDWPYSSYFILLGEENSLLKRDFVIRKFGGTARFEKIHRKNVISPASFEFD